MTRFVRPIAAAMTVAAPAAAFAHTGHGIGSLLAGLVHPLGPDHLLAMLAVGLWSVAALPARRRLIGPAVFMAGLLAGAVAAVAGLALPLVDIAIAASVALFGAMLLLPRALPRAAALGVVAAAAVLHGLAHGAELPPGAAFESYAAGFLVATAGLLAAGLGLGRALQHAHRLAWHAVAAVVGTVGLALLALA